MKSRFDKWYRLPRMVRTKRMLLEQAHRIVRRRKSVFQRKIKMPKCDPDKLLTIKRLPRYSGAFKFEPKDFQ